MRYIIIGLTILLSGCSIKDYQLFNNENPSYVSQPHDINIRYESKVLPDDILNIDIYNMNQKSNILKDKEILGTRGDKDKNQYIVSSDGTIYLPLLQEVKVEGFTVRGLSRELTERYRTYLKQPYVKVAIKNHKIYVLGEVNKQGAIPLVGNSLSLIEAISKSGGLTDYAMRNRIHVIGKSGDRYKIRTLDLSRFETLNVDNLVLKNGDIVYVEPRGGKAIKVGIQDYLPILQAISNLASTILSIDYITDGR